MIEYFFVFIFVVLLSVFYRKTAVFFHVLDNPNERSSHKTPIIRGIGIIFFLSFTCFFINSGFQYPLLYVGSFIVTIISFLDDIKGVSWWIRILLHVLGLVLCIYELGILENDTFIVFFTLILVGVSFVNIYNFMDGINGMMFLNASITLFFLFLVNYDTPVVNPDLIIYIAISVFIFGYFNFRKKAIAFSGDVGSIFLGSLFFFLLCKFVLVLQAPVLVLLFAVYAVEAVVTIIIRLINGENILLAHRQHLYERFVDKGLSHKKVSISYAVIQVLINLIVLYFYGSLLKTQIFIIVLITTILLFLYFILFKKIRIEDKKN